MRETCIRSLGHYLPLEESMATHSSILAWRILWTEEPGGLQSIASQRAVHNLRDWGGTDRQMFLLFGIKLPPKIWLHFESYLKIKMNALYQILSNDDHVSNCCSLGGLLFWRDLFGDTHLGLTVRWAPHMSLCAAHDVLFSSGNNHFIPSENPSLSACKAAGSMAYESLPKIEIHWPSGRNTKIVSAAEHCGYQSSGAWARQTCALILLLSLKSRMTWCKPLNFFSLFWSYPMECGISIPQAGIQCMPPGVEAQIRNHWTTREVPI